jgi:hypothetical protein
MLCKQTAKYVFDAIGRQPIHIIDTSCAVDVFTFCNANNLYITGIYIFTHIIGIAEVDLGGIRFTINQRKEFNEYPDIDFNPWLCYIEKWTVK